MTSKYKLKPGNHQFAPGSPAIHNNVNLTDADAKWYLQKFPHIAALFEVVPQLDADVALSELTKTRKRARVKGREVVATSRAALQLNPLHENLSTTN